MPDRKKVIKGLECCTHTDMCCMEISCYHPNYLECPYHDISDCVSNLVKDALELLKEQNAVEPKQVDIYGKYECWGLVCGCPYCEAIWMISNHGTHFCPNCGKQVKF